MNVTIRMLPSLKKAAHQFAIAQGVSLSDLVEEAVETLLRKAA
jgi:predicted HicB family RNase H-like nuclease